MEHFLQRRQILKLLKMVTLQTFPIPALLLMSKPGASNHPNSILIAAPPTPTEIVRDAYIELMDSSRKEWVEMNVIPNSSSSYKLYFMDTIPNGLCFFYCLRLSGISDPRNDMVHYLMENSGNVEILWWMNTFRYTIESGVEHLQREIDAVTSRNNLPSCWANESLIALACIVFKVEIFVLEQSTKFFRRMHFEVVKRFPSFEFERKPIYMLHHAAGTVQNHVMLSGFVGSENHYGLLDVRLAEHVIHEKNGLMTSIV